MLCVGLASLLAFQSFANIAVATGILPNTGLPLPFISYGVSSLLSVFWSRHCDECGTSEKSNATIKGGFSYEYRFDCT
ncbi:MAG: FtsW/RodA/SpoVE family cell cycle protein [Lachnospiraceae bacterium]